MHLTELTEEALTDELIDRLLFDKSFTYRCQKADLIMVLGSKKSCLHRAPVAAVLFRLGAAPKMLLCGGKVQDTPVGHMPEYLSMLKVTDASGVPGEAVLTEERSLTTEENFTFAREIIEERLPQCRRIILVTAGYHMRRALLMAKRAMPEFEFIPAAVRSGTTAADRWKLTEKGRANARDEAMKLRWYAERGRIEDIEI